MKVSKYYQKIDENKVEENRKILNELCWKINNIKNNDDSIYGFLLDKKIIEKIIVNKKLMENIVLIFLENNKHQILSDLCEISFAFKNATQEILYNMNDKTLKEIKTSNLNNKEITTLFSIVCHIENFKINNKQFNFFYNKPCAQSGNTI